MHFDFERFAEEAYNDPGNHVSAGDAISPALVGLRMFDAPIFGVGDASDPMFEAMRSPKAIGQHFRIPIDWLPDAERVISFFLPYSRQVKESNEAKWCVPSPQWLHGRYEGQAFLLRAAQRLCAQLEAAGEKALVPVLQKQFCAVERAEPGYEPFGPDVSFTSNWSERHVAYICGLGTFSLNRAIITEKGICGRFGSVVTTALLPVTGRRYTELYEYCSCCGACMRNCPVDAISLEGGKKQPPCARYLNRIKEQYAPRYGCGKCQVKVPCRDHIPKK